MCVYDSGGVEMPIHSLRRPHARMDVLIGCQKEGEEQRQASLESNYTPHDWAEYALAP
jgi:hypothetical protein